MRSSARMFLVGMEIALLAACAVGPNFDAPHEPVPDRYAGAQASAAKLAPPAPAAPTAASPAAGAAAPGATAVAALPAVTTPRATSDTEPDQFWWRQFHDAELDALETRAATGNLDLKSAYLRIVESRMQVLQARAQGLPSLNASAAVTREQLGLAGIIKSQGIGSGGTTSASTQQLISSLESPVNIYQLGFDASWELDFFGKLRRTVEAAKAQSAQAVEARNDLLVSLEAEVAQDYLQMRGAQTLRQVTIELIAAQREVLDLTRNRQQHGLAGEADVASARGQLASLEAQLPPDELTIATSRHALAVLTGQTPEALDAKFNDSGTLPVLPTLVPVGLPSTLARRRPDIREAEESLHQATAQIGVSVAAFFPDVSLAGTFGLRNTASRDLFDWSSKFYTFGPKISIPIFDGGNLTASLQLSRAEAAAAALSYRKTVLTALQEIEDNLTALQTDAARSASLREAIDADQRALDVDLDGYRHGILSYINVLTVQIQVSEARQQLAQALLTQSGDLVKLYKALGGGWEKSGS